MGLPYGQLAGFMVKITPKKQDDRSTPPWAIGPQAIALSLSTEEERLRQLAQEEPCFTGKTIEKAGA